MLNTLPYRNKDTLRAMVQYYLLCNSANDQVLMDSTGLPNSIHFPLTAVSNHNGKISREVRMTTLVQRDTGYSLLFRITLGNIVDLSTVTRTLNELFLRDMSADFVIMDAGYYTNDNIEELYACEVDFITRLSSKYTIVLSAKSDIKSIRLMHTLATMLIAAVD